MKYKYRVTLITPIIYIVGVLGCVPAWVYLCYKTQRYNPFVLGRAMWWAGLRVGIETAKEAAMEADKYGN